MNAVVPEPFSANYMNLMGAAVQERISANYMEAMKTEIARAYSANYMDVMNAEIARAYSANYMDVMNAEIAGAYFCLKSLFYCRQHLCRAGQAAFSELFQPYRNHIIHTESMAGMIYARRTHRDKNIRFFFKSHA